MSRRHRLQRDQNGAEYLAVRERGRLLLENPLLNKGTAWPEEERGPLGLVGLLPPHVSSEKEQLNRAWEGLRRKTSDIDRFVFLAELQDRNEVLFYKLLTTHIGELMPVIYTPTVGFACRDFHHLFRRSRGLYITPDCVDQTEAILHSVDGDGVEVAVVTDGERILGLGDLGTNGMGIPIGKLALYVAAGGFHPAATLPVVLDVGTDNEALRSHPLYLGTRRPRLRGAAYDRVVDAFVAGFERACPRAVLQFEDFAKGNAGRLLARYQDRLPTFNDDIQGTGAVAAAAVRVAEQVTGRAPGDERVLLVGAGSAGVGIAEELEALGVPRLNLWLLDSRGVVTAERPNLEASKARYAVDQESLRRHGLVRPDAALSRIVAAYAPTVLIGTSGQPSIFGHDVIRAMLKGCDRPVVLPLSNPTAKSEADPQMLAEWSDGRALVATGSPFPPVAVRGERYPVAQCNNVFIFPGIGLGAKVAQSRRITKAMFTQAAKALAATVSQAAANRGQLLPDTATIREVTVHVAAAVAAEAERGGHAGTASADWLEACRNEVWSPRYLPFRPA